VEIEVLKDLEDHKDTKGLIQQELKDLQDTKEQIIQVLKDLKEHKVIQDQQDLDYLFLGIL
jgi:hypothetical protein